MMLDGLKFVGTMVAVGSLAACGPQVKIEDGGTDGEGTSTTNTSVNSDPSSPATSSPTDPTNPTDPTDPTDPDDTGNPPPLVEAPVDILVVLDNSGSMGEEQGWLAQAMPTLFTELDALGVDYRVGVTTTDNGNPWCDGTSPEGGRLVATSCRTRTQDFVFNGAQVIDATAEACLDVCPEEVSTQLALGVPWIEGGPSGTNLPAGITPAQAAACIVPQGISGCGFEEPLESMYKAIARAQTSGEASFGFIRDNALLAVLVVSDEADCSFNKQWETIFLPDGNRVFWSDPTTGAPTSAVCWNAGVSCDPLRAGYDCYAADKDVDANPVPAANAGELAVLFPVARYLDQFADIEAAKQAVIGQGHIVFGLIGGVDSTGGVVYDDALGDPLFQDSFGIGPGCSGPAGQAVPPVRMRDMASAQYLGDQNMFSVCNGDYGSALQGFVANIAALMP